MGSIDFRSGESAVDLTGEVHHLPCCIKYNGPSSVSQYFKPKPTGVEVEDLKVEEAQFRGRRLQGTTIHMPEGYSGSVLGKKNLSKSEASSDFEDQSNCWEVNARFQSITTWNHDNLPSQDDAFLRSFHWINVAKALHRPVTSDDLTKTGV
ncbi:uncharacterized protein C12B10.15c [Impatiens glandulifera]|uniref:uncharacterized protein C12B10.15c n=1 Tax=Impatiens glandulifera TaxID=253017 RepID=UPI001FB133EA|nr:uncharacterized protein C12B10.15c [Impatiens glandulifera]XP_047332880.1 uncharacterized protein C12B10.15c [Impatiens glandulifera]